MRHALVLCALAVVSVEPAHAAPSYPWPAYSVVPVFFVPKDWDVNSTEVQAEAAALRSALIEIRQFYAHALGGNTFILNDLIVLQASGPKEKYGIRWNGGNIYTDGVNLTDQFEGAIVTELHDRGFPTPPDQNENGYVVPIFVKGAGGWAGGRSFGTGGDSGWSIVGDWAIDSLQGQVPEGAYWWSGRTLQLGAVAHELGHGFGLQHPDTWGGTDAGMLMGDWWGYPDAALLGDREKDQLNQSRLRYFSQCLPPVPLDPPPAVKPYQLFMLPTLGADTWALHINAQGCISASSETTPSTDIKWCSIRTSRSSILAAAAASRRRPLRSTTITWSPVSGKRLPERGARHFRSMTT